MSDSPTTFHGEGEAPRGIDWNDHASVHDRPNGNKSNMLRGFNVMREGTFAEMVKFVASLPEDQRKTLVIQKAGDRVFELPEIMELSRRDDLPK